jgi:hypothetical protein
MEPSNKLLRICKPWLAESVVKRLALLIESLKEVSPDNQDIGLFAFKGVADF